MLAGAQVSEHAEEVSPVSVTWQMWKWWGVGFQKMHPGPVRGPLWWIHKGRGTSSLGFQSAQPPGFASYLWVSLAETFYSAIRSWIFSRLGSKHALSSPKLVAHRWYGGGGFHLYFSRYWPFGYLLLWDAYSNLLLFSFFPLLDCWSCLYNTFFFFNNVLDMNSLSATYFCFISYCAAYFFRLIVSWWKEILTWM